MLQRNVYRISDLYDFNRKCLYTCSQLKYKYHFGNFLVWESILHSIPVNWKEVIARENPEVAISNKNLEEITSITKAPRWAYTQFLKKSQNVNEPKQTMRKWEQELNGTLNWSGSLKATYALTSDPKLRWLQYRLIMRTLTTNRRLHIYGIRENDSYEKCPGIRENITHLFWHCQYVQAFWITLGERLRVTERLCLTSIITGLYPPNETNWNVAIQLCILLAKQFIWSSKHAKMPINLNTFINFASNYINIEKYVATNEGKMRSFQEKWQKVADRLGIG